MRQYYEKLKRSLAYFKFGWNNRDFDDGYLIELEVFKMKRMLYLFENYGYHSEDCPNYKPKMKSIRLAIKLGERLIKDDYSRFSDKHHKKYGKVTYDSEPIPDSKNSRLIYKKDGFKYNRTEEEVKSLLESYRADERDMMRDRRRFYHIIEKYGRYWWD